MLSQQQDAGVSGMAPLQRKRKRNRAAAPEERDVVPYVPKRQKPAEEEKIDTSVPVGGQQVYASDPDTQRAIKMSQVDTPLRGGPVVPYEAAAAEPVQAEAVGLPPAGPPAEPVQAEAADPEEAAQEQAAIEMSLQPDVTTLDDSGSDPHMPGAFTFRRAGGRELDFDVPALEPAAAEQAAEAAEVALQPAQEVQPPAQPKVEQQDFSGVTPFGGEAEAIERSLADAEKRPADDVPQSAPREPRKFLDTHEDRQADNLLQQIVDRHNDAAEPSVVAPGAPADSGFDFPAARYRRRRGHAAWTAATGTAATGTAATKTAAPCWTAATGTAAWITRYRPARTRTVEGQESGIVFGHQEDVRQPDCRLYEGHSKGCDHP